MDNQKRWLFSFGKLVTMPALFLLVLLAGSTTAYAANYDLYIGDTQVTDDNKGDILKDKGQSGAASYDADKKTLTLNGVNIGADAYHTAENSVDGERYNFSLYAGTDVVKHLVITGNNTFVSKASESNGNGGIYFSVSGPIDAVPPYGSSEDPKYYAYIYYSLIITGTGTLTSTATEGDTGTAMTVAGEAAEQSSYQGGFIMGNGTPKDNIYWNGDGTGPTLKLTGWDAGADFSSTGRFHMHGGTIIAEAKNSTAGTGIYLADGMGNYNYFEGGTTAGYGTYNENDWNGNGAFYTGYEAAGDLDPDSNTATEKVKNHGMRRVYPETGDYIPNEISGWCVVGMTRGEHAADTNAVLAELGLIVANKEVNTVKPDADDKASDPKKLSAIDPTAEDNPDTPANDPYVDTDVDVWGFAQNTVYSVDVEWGAMTFEYKAEWNAETYQMGEGSWKVYDTGSNSSIEDTQHAINKVTVTNHSNAKVYAQLSYTPENTTKDYSSISGTFAEPTNASDNTNATWTNTDTDGTDGAINSTGYYELQSSADAEGGAGTAAAGTVYFTPNSISNAVKTSGIKQWTKIGKITVGILTEQP